MKKTKISLLAAVFLSMWGQPANAQLCIEQESKTDPRKPINTLTGYQNQWFWFPGNGNKHEDLYHDCSPNSSHWDTNPYWINNPGSITAMIAQQDLSDMYPEDGWELIKVAMGQLTDGTVRNDANTMENSPYIILYNRHRGLMRVFQMHKGVTWGPQIVHYEVTLVKEDESSDKNLPDHSLRVSNTLSIQGQSLQPLDQKTSEHTLEFLVDFPA